jgi:hypothetical protein
MRRLVVSCAAVLVLVVPATATALRSDPGDTTLVVRNADNGDGSGADARPVVTLVVSGFVIGRIANLGRIDIYDLDPSDVSTPEVTGALWHKDVSRTVTGQNDSSTTQSGTRWGGTDFRFRAVGGTYRVVIWGSGVYVFAFGHGTVWFTGQTDPSVADGQFSLNGGDWHSLPASGTKQLGLPAGG